MEHFPNGYFVQKNIISTKRNRIHITTKIEKIFLIIILCSTNALYRTKDSAQLELKNEN